MHNIRTAVTEEQGEMLILLIYAKVGLLCQIQIEQSGGHGDLRC